MAKPKSSGQSQRVNTGSTKSTGEIKIKQKICTAMENTLELLIADIGKIKIANKRQLPFGWRKAAKGRTVWRIFEEIITQNLEKNPSKYCLETAVSAQTETDIFDLKIRLKNIKKDIYINIKSAGTDHKNSKDDISKALKIIEFFEKKPQAELYIATFNIKFNANLRVEIVEAFIMPICWIPDIYVNPSNNGNLQSAYCKDASKAIKRTNEQFISELNTAIKVANKKRTEKMKAEKGYDLENLKTIKVKTTGVQKKNRPKAA